MKETLVVLGGKMAAARLIGRLIELGAASRYRITLVCPEPHIFQRSGLIPTAPARSPSTWSISASIADHFGAHGVELRCASTAVDLDTQAKRLVMRDGSSIGYERLVFATGSVPISGCQLGRGPEGVSFSLGDPVEMARLSRIAAPMSSTVVVGGGASGIEAAWALRARGVAVRLVEASPRLMAGLLDHPGAAVVGEHLSRAGIEVSLDHRISDARPSRSGGGVVLSAEDRPDIGADFVLWATGSIAEDRVARRAGILCAPRGGGIVVDSKLETSSPCVYAVGSCTYFPPGLGWSPMAAMEQAEVLAGLLSEKENRSWEPVVDVQLGTPGLDLAVLGSPVLGPPSAHVSNPLRGIYKAATVSEGRLKAAVLVGDCTPAPMLRLLLAQKVPLSWDPSCLVGQPGRFVPERLLWPTSCPDSRQPGRVRMRSIAALEEVPV